MDRPAEKILLYIENDDSNSVGSVEGLIIYNFSQLDNWLSKQDVSASARKYLHTMGNNLFPLGLLENINIELEYRGQGWGAVGMDMWFSRVYTPYYLLESDLGEDNKFDLTQWYMSYGYEIIGYTNNGNPIMLKVRD